MIPILYDDAEIIAIDKPAGISSIPERDLSVPSIVKLLESQLGRKLFIVHRLDKEVSGVMLFAKSAASHKYLNDEFFNRKVTKSYCAVVHGAVEKDALVIDEPIRQFGSGRMGVDRKKGKPSRTPVLVVERGILFSRISATPSTGRRHQIRVHCYHAGHPIAGDQFYGDKALQKDFPRLMLHAQTISFKKPDGTTVAVESPLPEEFIAQMRQLLDRT